MTLRTARALLPLLVYVLLNVFQPLGMFPCVIQRDVVDVPKSELPMGVEPDAQANVAVSVDSEVGQKLQAYADLGNRNLFLIIVTAPGSVEHPSTFDTW